MACKDGEKCTRKICFFYHNEEEKRVPTGLQDARAQIAAELGGSADGMNGDTLRAGAAPFLAGLSLLLASYCYRPPAGVQIMLTLSFVQLPTTCSPPAPRLQTR